MNNGMKVLWFVSVGAAFFLGYSINATTKQNNNKASQIVEKPKLIATDITNEDITLLKEPTKLENVKTTTKKLPDLHSLLNDLENLLDGGQFSFDMAAIAQAYKLIENLTEDEILSTLNLMSGKLNKPKNVELLSLLVGRLASFEPLKAASFIEGNIDSPQAKMAAMLSMISSWVKDDPASAYYWYVDPNNSYTSRSSFSSVGLLAIFKGLASQDVNDALTKLSELESAGVTVRIAATGIGQSIEHKEDFIQIIERYNELGNQNIKDSLISSWVLKSPSETIEWSETIEDKIQQKKMQSTIFMNWTATEPESAADWYIGTANEFEKESHATKIINMWAMREPYAALEWLDQQTSFDTQKSLAKLLKSSTYTNTNFAINNLNRLTTDKSKTDISYRIYQALERNSPTKAAEFLSSSPYQEEIEKRQMTINNYKKEDSQS